MHEAGLARTFVTEVERRGLECARLSVIMPPGHEPGDDFERSFRAHVQAMAGWYRAELVDVVVDPAERICARCVKHFWSSDQEPQCPACGGAPLPAGDAVVQFEVIPANGGSHVP